jgi:hypothetical protein
MMSHVLGGLMLWAVGAFALYWNLRSARILPSNDHVRVLAVLWPVALVGLLGWGIYKLLKLGTRHAVVDTVVSFTRVVDTYRYGSLLPRHASAGNDLKPPDEFEREAARIVENLLKETP